MEQGEGVGGTWYWNRYPGARCDSESHGYAYFFSRALHESWQWSERYPGHAEIRQYLNYVADQLDLKKDAMIKNLDIDKFSFAVLEKFKLYDNNSIILDKAPLNFMWIGHINLLFPDAKIIHCKRNLKDTALSIYKNMFDASALTWTYNQDHLIGFVELYQELMNFWHKKIPNYIYDCSYEELVSNKENETRKLIEFCNLEWEDNCIDHTKNKTGIKITIRKSLILSLGIKKNKIPNTEIIVKLREPFNPSK